MILTWYGNEFRSVKIATSNLMITKNRIKLTRQVCRLCLKNVTVRNEAVPGEDELAWAKIWLSQFGDV